MAFVEDGLAMQCLNQIVAMTVKVRGNLPLSDISQVAQFQCHWIIGMLINFMGLCFLIFHGPMW